MREQSAGALFASAWVGTELAGALALKRRLGELDDVTHAKVTRAAAVLLTSLSSIPVETRHFVDAQRLVSSPPKGLRSGDALHLAIVMTKRWASRRSTSNWPARRATMVWRLSLYCRLDRKDRLQY